MRHVLAIAIAMLPSGPWAAPVHAQSIHQCVAQGRAVSYQSRPCGAGETTVSIRPYTPEPVRLANPAATMTAGASRTRSGRLRQARFRAAGTPRDPCAEARSQRDEWERHIGLKRTYDQLRAWNDRVARACP